MLFSTVIGPLGLFSAPITVDRSKRYFYLQFLFVSFFVVHAFNVLFPTVISPLGLLSAPITCMQKWSAEGFCGMSLILMNKPKSCRTPQYAITFVLYLKHSLIHNILERSEEIGPLGLFSAPIICMQKSSSEGFCGMSIILMNKPKSCKTPQYSITFVLYLENSLIHNILERSEEKNMESQISLTKETTFLSFVAAPDINLVMLNKVRRHALFFLSANQIVWSRLLIQIHIINY